MQREFIERRDLNMTAFWRNAAANYEAMLAVMTAEEQTMLWIDYRDMHRRKL